jgi:hypothetical protein
MSVTSDQGYATGAAPLQNHAVTTKYPLAHHQLLKACSQHAPCLTCILISCILLQLYTTAVRLTCSSMFRPAGCASAPQLHVDAAQFRECSFDAHSRHST